MTYTQNDVMQFIELMGEPIKKARVYVKNPSDVPQGIRVQTGKHGGHYYETEASQAQPEAPKEKRNLDALNPRIYDNYDKMLHFETGKEVLVYYLHNTEKAPDMGSRFGQDIEPSGKYVINNEYGPSAGEPPKGFVSSVEVLHSPLVLDWKDWKKRLSSFYGNKTKKDLSDALIADGFDSIVTIDGENVSEMVLLKPKIQTYDELKATKHFKGSTDMYNDATQSHERYDVFKFDDVDIRVKSDDLPTNIAKRVIECADSFKYSSLKADNRPIIKFLGKTHIREFDWKDREGKDHTSTYGGTANYITNDISIYDDYSVDDIIYHEVGHFVYKRLMSAVDAKPDAPIKGLAYLSDINDYYKMIDILRTHDVPISAENIEKILDDIDYVRQLGLMEDMHNNNLKYYDRGYSALSGLHARLKDGYGPDITPFDEKQWKKYRTLRKAEHKSNTLRNEWYDIWQTEGYRSKEYANRNNSETFAEFYQTVDRVLRYNDDIKQQYLTRLAGNHPLKMAFFKKYVVGKFLK
jgi:hypothetical protein